MSELNQTLAPPDIAEDIKDLQLDSSAEENVTADVEDGKLDAVVTSDKTDVESIANSKPVQIKREDIIDVKEKESFPPDDVEDEVDDQKKRHLNVVFIGHVDAGKSTIGGQTLFLSGQVDDRTIQKYEKEAKEKSRESWYMAYIMDTNEEERAKGKTVEVGRAHFETETTRFTILDAPVNTCFFPLFSPISKAWCTFVRHFISLAIFPMFFPSPRGVFTCYSSCIFLLFHLLHFSYQFLFLPHFDCFMFHSRLCLDTSDFLEFIKLGVDREKGDPRAALGLCGVKVEVDMDFYNCATLAVPGDLFKPSLENHRALI